MTQYRIASLDSEEEILRFWEESPDASIFTHPHVLPKLVQKLTWLAVYKNTNIICIWPVCEPDLRNGGRSRYLYYVGPFWTPLRLEWTYSSFFEVASQAYALFVQEIRERKGMTEASLASSVYDLRFLHWNTNFNRDADLKIELVPRYTAVIDNLQESSKEQIKSSMNRNRRREIKAFSACQDLQVCQDMTSEELIELYFKFFVDREQERDKSDEASLRALCELVAEGYGYYVAYRNGKTKELVSVFLCLFGKSVSNGILSITLDEYKDTGVGTFSTLEAIFEAKDLGLDTFDFNGANSPILAKFKHGMAAVPQMYYDLKFRYN